MQAVLRGAQRLQTEQQERQDGRRAQEGGDEPAFGQELQVVVLGVLDAEAAGRGLEAGQRVLECAEAGADRGARGGEAQGVPPDGQAVRAGLVARDAGEGENPVARLRGQDRDEQQARETEAGQHRDEASA